MSLASKEPILYVPVKHQEYAVRKRFWAAQSLNMNKYQLVFSEFNTLLNWSKRVSTVTHLSHPFACSSNATDTCSLCEKSVVYSFSCLL